MKNGRRGKRWARWHRRQRKPQLRSMRKYIGYTLAELNVVTREILGETNLVDNIFSMDPLFLGFLEEEESPQVVRPYIPMIYGEEARAWMEAFEKDHEFDEAYNDAMSDSLDGIWGGKA